MTGTCDMLARPCGPQPPGDARGCGRPPATACGAREQRAVSTQGAVQNCRSEAAFASAGRGLGLRTWGMGATELQDASLQLGSAELRSCGAAELRPRRRGRGCRLLRVCGSGSLRCPMPAAPRERPQGWRGATGSAPRNRTESRHRTQACRSDGSRPLAQVCGVLLRELVGLRAARARRAQSVGRLA